MKKAPFHVWVGLIFKLILFAEVAAALWRRQWSTAAITTGIVLIIGIPLLMKRKFRITIPPEFELLSIAFIFAALFLGEVRGYYIRFWWWDIALHTGSGLLLGIFGFLMVYVLNETEDIELHMKPGFVALFAFLFAIGIGAIWEIFEFSMDSFFGTNMQKPMLKDPSGLTDTMWDLIVDTLGALFISVLGYSYMKTVGKDSFLERWISDFIDNNPRLFNRNQ